MGAIRARVLILAAGLLGLTAWQLPTWRSDSAVWAVAVQMNLVSPRPAYNHALALRKDGRYGDAVEALLDVVQRAKGSPQEVAWRQAVQSQFMAIELAGVPVCESSRVRPYC